MSDAGERWLAGELARQLEMITGLSAQGQGPSPLVIAQGLKLLGAVDALAAADVLNVEQEQRARARLAEVGIRREKTSWSVSLRNQSSSVRTMVGTPVEASPQDAAVLSPPAEAPRLLRVIPLTTTLELDGCELVLIAAELWDSEIVLTARWQRPAEDAAKFAAWREELRRRAMARQSGDQTEAPPPVSPHLDRTAQLHWTLSVEGEGRVQSGPGGMSGDDRYWRLTTLFRTPAPHEGAAVTLTAKVGDSEVSHTFTA